MANSKSPNIDKLVTSDQFKGFLKDIHLKIDDFTCYNCKDKDTCSNAFDPYNINGYCVKTDTQ